MGRYSWTDCHTVLARWYEGQARGSTESADEQGSGALMQESAIRNGAGSPRPGDGATADTVLDRTFNLLEFSSAVAREVGPAPVRAIGSHPCAASEGVPRHQAVVVGTTTERTTDGSASIASGHQIPLGCRTTLTGSSPTARA